MIEEITLDLDKATSNAADTIDDMEAFPIRYWAERMGVCEKTLRNAIWNGELECLRFGKAIRITKKQFAKYLKDYCMGASK